MLEEEWIDEKDREIVIENTYWIEIRMFNHTYKIERHAVILSDTQGNYYLTNTFSPKADKYVREFLENIRILRLSSLRRIEPNIWYIGDIYEEWIEDEDEWEYEDTKLELRKINVSDVWMAIEKIKEMAIKKWRWEEQCIVEVNSLA